jgi:hypothetical protein
MKKMFYFLTMMLVMFSFVACSNDENILNANKKNFSTWHFGYIPINREYVSIIDTISLDIIEEHFYAPGYARVLTQPILKADGNEPWQAQENLQKNLSSPQGTVVYSFNYGGNTIGWKVTPVTYDGKEVGLYRSDLLNLTAGEPSTEVSGNGYDDYEALTSINHILRYEEAWIADSIQLYLAKAGYTPEWENVMLDHRHDSVYAGQAKNNVLPIFCANRQLFAQKSEGGILRDSVWVPFECLNAFVLDFSEVKTNDFGNMKKVYTFDANGCITVNGIEQKVTHADSASVVGSIVYNGVEYTDSLHVCWYDPKTLTIVSTDSADIMFQHREKLDMINIRVGFPTTEVTIREILRRFWHTIFPKEASVVKENIYINHQDKAEFKPILSDNSIGVADTVNYGLKHTFKYSLKKFVSLDLKGQTVTFQTEGNNYKAEELSLSLVSLHIDPIMYQGHDYADEADSCELIPQTAYYSEKNVVITFTHDNETVTATVPVSYNYIVKYELVGEPVHKNWNGVTGNGNTFNITCDNYVVVRQVFADGTYGDSIELPYLSTNTWTASTTNIVVENLNSIIGVREEIVDGSVNIGLTTINFSHTMHAESVSKGTFSYKPTPCEAVARYITVVNDKTAIVEIYHDGTKVGEYELPINITEIIIIPGKIKGGNRSDAYTDQYSARVTYDFIKTTSSSSSKKYQVYSKLEEDRSFGLDGEYDNFGYMSESDPFAYWYDQNGYKHLGTFEAIKMDANNTQESYLILYKDMSLSTVYTLGTAEEKLANRYRNPNRGTLVKVVMNGVTLWTFDHLTFYKGTED